MVVVVRIGNLWLIRVRDREWRVRMSVRNRRIRIIKVRVVRYKYILMWRDREWIPSTQQRNKTHHLKVDQNLKNTNKKVIKIIKNK